jgi:hypothetical protein
MIVYGHMLVVLRLSSSNCDSLKDMRVDFAINPCLKIPESVASFASFVFHVFFQFSCVFKLPWRRLR